MIYLYLFGTCFHFIYVFMIIENNNTISDSSNIGSVGDSIGEYTQTYNTNPLDKIVELYERLLKEEKERVKTLEKRIKELEGKA